MKCHFCERCPMALALRWFGRTLGLATIAFVMWFLIAHIAAGDGPNPLQMNGTEFALFATFLAALSGMLIGWRWELFGGLLVVVGMALFFIIDRSVTGTWPTGWLLWLFPLPGLCYLLASCFETCRARHLKVSS